MDHRDHDQAGPNNDRDRGRRGSGDDDRRFGESGGYGRQQAGESGDMGRPGQGGGSYGMHDRSEAARRSEHRDDQRYSSMHQDQGGFTGFAGYGGPPPKPDHAHDHEPDYKHWKDSRLADLDREHHEKRSAQVREWDDHYSKFREEKRSKFHNEFEGWRSRQSAQNQTSTAGQPGDDRSTVQAGSGTNIGEGRSAMDKDDERTKSTSSPGGGERTDMSGVGDQGAGAPSGPGGGAGLRGAGAAGGSSATMASGSASAGAHQLNTGASAAGVTTGSENKPDAPTKP